MRRSTAACRVDGVSPKPGGLPELIDYVKGFEAGLQAEINLEYRAARLAVDPRLNDTLLAVQMEADAKRRRMERSVAEGTPNATSSGAAAPLTRSVLKSMGRWSTSSGSSTLAAVDAVETEKWTKRVLTLLAQGGAPEYAAAQRSPNPELISRNLLGGARASTICRRSRMWEGLVRWLQWHHDCAWPRSADDLVGYMADVMQERPTKTFPRHFAGAVS